MVPVAKATTTKRSLHAGVGLAHPFSGLGVRAGRSRIGMTVRQSSFPVAVSSAVTNVSFAFPPALAALVKKSLVPQVTGELLPPPGLSNFHLTFFVGLQTVGIDITSILPF